MKKLILSAAIVLGSLSTINAQAKEEQAAPAEATTPATDEFTEVKVEEVSAAVTEALKKAFSDAVLNKAYVNGKKEYKLEVKTSDKESVLYADETGKWIQK
jgi:L-aminopeptidase/D-esterase-like protein